MARQCETLCGFLAEMGYVAFTFDFCGGSAMCGKSDGKTTEMSVLTETKDLKAVIEYVRNLSYTDSEVRAVLCLLWWQQRTTFR